MNMEHIMTNKGYVNDMNLLMILNLQKEAQMKAVLLILSDFSKVRPL